MDIEFINELARKIADVNDEQLAMQDSQLDMPADEDKRLGVIHNMDARKLWAVARTWSARSIMYGAAATISADREKAKALEAKGRKMEQYADAARALFWQQVRTDLDAWGIQVVGVRQGWMLVSTPEGTARWEARKMSLTRPQLKKMLGLIGGEGNPFETLFKDLDQKEEDFD